MSLPLAERQRRTQLLLEEFGITHIARSRAYALSGGERRRVEIARSLAINPAFILLDEPFAGIDPIAVFEIQRIVSQLRARGIGILITDHNVRETLKITDRAYIIKEGEIFRAGCAGKSLGRRRGPPNLPRRDIQSKLTGEGTSAVPTDMALEQKLHLKLSQKLIMTPSLQQAIKLLQLSKLELQEVLNQELLENPLLEESAEEAKAEETQAEETKAENEYRGAAESRRQRRRRKTPSTRSTTTPTSRTTSSTATTRAGWGRSTKSSPSRTPSPARRTSPIT